MKIEEAIEFMKKKHEGQKRKHGAPYYTHPLAVKDILKEKGFDEKYQIVGLFHDLLEDTNTSYEEIKELTDNQTAIAVDLLTKKQGYIMKEYIGNIKQNEIATAVKLADRIHNLSEAKYCSKEFQEKYIKETKDWFTNLAKGTVFENDLNTILNTEIKIYQNAEIKPNVKIS